MAESALNRAYLTLGSNINPEHHLPRAVQALSRYGDIFRVSHVWETSPVGYADQPNFVNAAILLATTHSADKLCLSAIPAIEQDLGRVRDPHNKNGPRTIDIDLALFNREILQVEHREIPDPDILTRPFVAAALAELDPDYFHPIAKKTLAEIAQNMDRSCGEMWLRTDISLSELIAQ